MPKKTMNGVMGHCASCHKQRLIDPNTKMCLPCENDHLKEMVNALELQLNACTKERAELMRNKTK